PRTGAVEGQLSGQKSGKPVAGRLVVLCEIETEPKCSLRAGFRGVTDGAGAFSIKNVPPGRYTAGYTTQSEAAAGKLKDGAPIDPSGPGRVLGGTVVDIGAGGKLANIRGAVAEESSGLTFEFRQGKLAIIEVRAGESARLEIKAWGQ
ncbi:MAG: carboxypeptidase-like regulatory domain-containing protein, partial [Terriglobales bacterium]